MLDYLIRIIAKDLGIRGLACVTTELVNEGARRHETSPTATLALGNGLTAATLMGALLKVQQRVALKFSGDGPLQKMLAESDSYGRVRGYVAQPHVDLPFHNGQPDVANAIGRNGLLTVAKDLRVKDLYEGVVPLTSGEVDEELSNYLLRSEQTPSLVEIGALLNEDGVASAAGGLLFQILPGEEARTLEAIFEPLQDIPPVAEALRSGATPESLLATVMTGFDYEVLEKRHVTFQCQCSWERSERALMMIGREDMEILIEEGQGVVDCHFCHQRYIFGREALEMLLEQMLG